MCVSLKFSWQSSDNSTNNEVLQTHSMFNNEIIALSLTNYFSVREITVSQVWYASV